MVFQRVQNPGTRNLCLGLERMLAERQQEFSASRDTRNLAGVHGLLALIVTSRGPDGPEEHLS